MVAPFLLVIKDEDAKVFSVVGPMKDDTSWTKRVVAAQKAGREVRCFTAGSVDRDEIVAGMKAQFGYVEVGAVSLPPPDSN